MTAQPVTLARPGPELAASILDRAGRDDYGRWAEQVRSSGYCSRPVRLRGTITRTGPDGQRSTYSTDDEPDRVLLIRCGNRRVSVCPSCSYEYAGDMWQLLYAGAAGGRKGVPESVRAHPLVFATLTAPGFGAVHTTRTDRRGQRARCRPARGKPTLCRHGRPTWCPAVHTDDDPRLGQPLCPDCYDYPAHVAFNWHAPELWRRFTITLRRTLARRAGMSAAEFHRRARVSYAKVAEYQRRAVVHFHALIRLDAPGNDYQPPGVPLGSADLADAIREAAGLVRLVVNMPSITDARSVPDLTGGPTSVASEAHTSQDIHAADQNPVSVAGHQTQGRVGEDSGSTDAQHGKPGARVARNPAASRRQHAPDAHRASIRHPTRLVMRFGTQTDTQPVNGRRGGALTPERVAAYIAKYATKSAEDFGLGDRRISLDALELLDITDHAARIAQTCWTLGGHDQFTGLRRWLHMLGFRGHFATKSRRYSTTLGALRAARRTYARQHAAGELRELTDEETTLVVARWHYSGTGYLTAGDAALALSAAARAREQRQAAREAADIA